MSQHSYKQELPQPRAAVPSNRARREEGPSTGKDLEISPAEWPDSEVCLLCLPKVRCWEQTGLFSTAASFVLLPGVFQ